jgi:PEP-CTERM motif
VRNAEIRTSNRKARQVIKRLAVAVLVTGVIGIGFLPMPASATLHGYCAGAGQCVDNGTNSPTSTNPPSNFGFVSSPSGETGQFRIDILVPNNAPGANALSFTLSGTLAGAAPLFSATAWTGAMGQQLDNYLGISASPANPIGAYLPSTNAIAPGNTGFFVYQASFASTPAGGLNGTMSENLNNPLPIGSYIVAFVLDNPNPTGGQAPWQATANSGAIFETGRVPEPTTLLLIGTGLVAVGAGAWRRRQR